MNRNFLIFLFSVALMFIAGCGGSSTAVRPDVADAAKDNFIGFDLIIAPSDAKTGRDHGKSVDVRDIFAPDIKDTHIINDPGFGCAGGCGAGQWCNSGACEKCNTDSHCTDQCIDCTKFGRGCSTDGTACLECSDANPCDPGYRCVSGKCEACNTAEFCGSDCSPCSGNTPNCTGGTCVCNDSSCPAGKWCNNGACAGCDTDTHCGLDCTDCTLTGTPVCTSGKCRCTTDGQCGAGKWCNNGTCEVCGNNDSLHCGPDCGVCTGRTPVCEGGACKCDTHEDCGDGFWCNSGKCEACNTAQRCGAKCQACTGETSVCSQGECVCSIDSCASGRYCEGKICHECANDDPAHCGPACTKCAGETPACVDGGCVCAGTSCGDYKRCVDGSCASCNTNDFCGQSCAPCSGARPFCKADGSGCVQCLNDPDCGLYTHCDNGVCKPDVEGCVTDESPSGKKCSQAKVIGRKNAAMGYLHKGDTTNDGDNDNLPSGLFEPGDCWDANDDNAFRIYLKQGDSVKATLVPNASTFDSMLKLYTGTACSAHKKDDLVGCYNQGGDHEIDGFEYTASADGWYSIVVDGRTAFDEDGDWGPYSLAVKLTCVEKNCNCP